MHLVNTQYNVAVAGCSDSFVVYTLSRAVPNGVFYYLVETAQYK